MKLKIPSYYKEFTCIADRCKDSCCIGWEIDIDEDTAFYYENVPGAFGKRLRQQMVSVEEEKSFRLKENGWCPFLNEKKLCDICIELGEEALSEVCTEYPRFTLEYGDVREKCLCLSCEEVGRIIFSRKEKTTFEEIELPEAGISERDEEDLYVACSQSPEPQLQTDKEDLCYEHNLERARDHAITLLQNREKSMTERISDYLIFCEKVQEKIADESLWREALEVEKFPEASNSRELFSYDAYLERLELLEELEVLDEEWVAEKEKMHTFYDRENYERLHREFLREQSPWEYEQEQLLVYLTFRYFMKAVYDCNFLSKAKFAVFTYQVILDMDVRRFKENGGYTREDRIDTARIYAKEVEHSQENLDLLEEAFAFGFKIG